MEKKRELLIKVEDRPGTFYKVSDAISKAGINIEGFSGTTCDEEGTLHLVTSDPEKTKRTLEQAGFPVVEEREVVVFKVQDRPGVLASVLKPIADNQINIGQAYLLTGDRIAIGADDIDRLREILREASPAGVVS